MNDVIKLGKLLLLTAIVVASISCNCNKKEKTCQGSTGIVIKDSLRYLQPIFDSIIIEKDIFFAEVKNNKDSLEKLHLDVYTPNEDLEKNRPAILWVHGGGFRGGTKTQSYISRLSNEFAKRGYVSISTDYRLRENPEEDKIGTISDAVSDVMQALNWVRDNSKKYGINKDYIIIGGGSAGGILSTNLCYKDATETEKWDKSGVIAFVNLWGSPANDRMDKVIDTEDPPTIFIHGKADTIVPYANCVWLKGELDKVGVENKVFAIEGAGHTPVGHMPDIVKNIAGFLFEIIGR